MLRVSYGWVIVAVGALMTCVAIGAMFSLAIFLEPMSTATGWSRAGISSAMTLNFLIMGPRRLRLGRGERPLRHARCADRRRHPGARVGVGEPRGIARSLPAYLRRPRRPCRQRLLAPIIATTTAWFQDNRSLGVSLVSTGMGVTPMTISPFARWLISTYDWRTAMLAIGILVWSLLLPAASMSGAQALRARSSWSLGDEPF